MFNPKFVRPNQFVSLFFLTAFFFFNLNFVFAQKPNKSNVYFPAENWEKRTASQVGMDDAKLKDAVDFAIANGSKASRNLELAHYQTFGREPFGEAVGAFKDRGDATGIIVRNGYIVAEWGEPNRVDMTFSVTKSFVSTVVGLAYDRKLIKNLQAPVRDEMAPILLYSPNSRFDKGENFGKSPFIELFETEHNRKITWETLLRQTSDWEGTLWGKPDWADRPSQNPAEWLNRKRNEPGAVYEYNDVRVNVLALAALNVWRNPLPQVLKEKVMDEIGASQTWRWFGYENAWVLIDGVPMQSVSGGGHWGGGMFINARDMARFGYLTLRRGKWNDKQILSEEFIKMATTPTSVQPTYGFMNWFTNPDKKYLAHAPVTAFVHVGNGTNIIYVDPENDLVIVARWIENRAVDGLVEKVLASINSVK